MHNVKGNENVVGDQTTLGKGALGVRDYGWQQRLEAVGDHLGDELVGHATQANGPELKDIFRLRLLGDKGHKRVI